MNFSPFSCPIFLGHLKARGRCSQGERVLYGRDMCSSGGTGKAEAAKPPGAGIGPKQCPGNAWQKKATYTDSVRIEMQTVFASWSARYCRRSEAFQSKTGEPNGQFLTLCKFNLTTPQRP